MNELLLSIKDYIAGAHGVYNAIDKHVVHCGGYEVAAIEDNGPDGIVVLYADDMHNEDEEFVVGGVTPSFRVFKEVDL